MKNLKTKKLKIGNIIVILFIIIVSSIYIVNSSAKYTSKTTVQDTAYIAKWSFEDGSTSTNIELKADSNIFDNVVENKIAPGMHGSFDIIIDAIGSDVGIDYEILITPEEGYQLPKGLTISQNSINGSIDYNINSQEMKKVITVNWEWTYGDNQIHSNYDEGQLVGANNQEAGITTNVNIQITGKQQAPDNT